MEVAVNKYIFTLLLALTTINIASSNEYHDAIENHDVRCIKRLVEQRDAGINDSKLNKSLPCIRISYTPLHLAVEKRNSLIAKELLKHPDINVKIKNFFGTAYDMALKKNFFDMAHVLTENSEIRSESISRNTLLLLQAIQDRHVDKVKYLIQYCDDLDINVALNREKDKTPLKLAIDSQDIDIIQEVLKHPDIDINIRDTYGEPLLHVIVKNRYTQALKVLLADPRLDINITDKYNKTPLHIAAEHGDSSILKILLNYSTIDVTKKTKFDKTALDIATEKYYKGNIQDTSYHKYYHAVRELYPYYNVANSENQNKLFFLAALISNDVDVVREFVNCFSIDINFKNNRGNTPLIEAVHMGHTEVVRELLKHPEIDVNCKSKDDNRTPLHIAIDKRAEDVAQILVFGRPNLERATQPQEKQDYIRAAEKKSVDLLRELLRHSDIDFNAQSDNQDTPLMAAIVMECVEFVQEMLQHPNISTFLKNNKSKVLNAAVSKQSADIVKELLKHSEDVIGDDQASLVALNKAISSYNTNKSTQHVFKNAIKLLLLEGVNPYSIFKSVDKTPYTKADNAIKEIIREYSNYPLQRDMRSIFNQSTNLSLDKNFN